MIAQCSIGIESIFRIFSTIWGAPRILHDDVRVVRLFFLAEPRGTQTAQWICPGYSDLRGEIYVPQRRDGHVRNLEDFGAGGTPHPRLSNVRCARATANRARLPLENPGGLRSPPISAGVGWGNVEGLVSAVVPPA